jgi:hypothetical protein
MFTGSELAAGVASRMFDKLKTLLAIIGLLAILSYGGFKGFVVYQQARAGAAAYVWLNSSPAKGQPPRIETLEKLITPPEK